MTSIVSTVRVELLDCIQVNLAVLADEVHGPATHLALGAPLRFRPGPGPDGLPTVEPGYAEQIEQSLPRLGLVPRRHWAGLSRLRLRETGAEHGLLYVVADTFEMPWLPYFGRKHMDHSYLLSGTGDHAEVSDAYHNETQWGTAAPGRWCLPWTDLPATATYAARFEPGPRSADVRPEVDIAAPDDYLAAYANHSDRLSAVDRMTVETWLLQRSRRLHAACRWAERPPADVAAHLEAWDRLAGQAFLALRRVQRGRPEPGHVLPELGRLLAADRSVLGIEAQPAHSR